MFRFGSKIHETTAPIAGGKIMGKWKRLKEAFRLSENLKESFRNLLARIGGEGERWGTDTPIIE